jgi:hypothetical protein
MRTWINALTRVAFEVSKSPNAPAAAARTDGDESPTIDRAKGDNDFFSSRFNSCESRDTGAANFRFHIEQG